MAFVFVSNCYIKRVLLAVFFWSFLFYIVFQFTGHQRAVTYITSHVAIRELLQQEGLPDYSHDSTKKEVQDAFLDLKPKTDNTPLTEKQLLKILSEHSSLPLAYWSNTTSKNTASDSCAKFPSLFDLDFNNIYWQRLSTTNGTFYLYGAYYDNRTLTGKVPVVRILGMVDRVEPPQSFCQFWYYGASSKNKHFSEASYTYIWDRRWGNYKNGILQPFIISCRIPIYNTNVSDEIPASVSLVGHQCDKPTNNLKVVNERPKEKQDFAVCVKGLDFLYDDISVRLVEWIELLNLLGAKKIFLYELEVHPNISKVLSYYVKRGLVELTPITLPGNQPNLPGFRHLYLTSKRTHKRQNEVIPYNDCLYKNLYSYEYVALLDIDEVIMPVLHESWSELMKNITEDESRKEIIPKASYNFRNVYFLDDLKDGEEMTHNSHEQGIPRYLHMLQHVYRSKNFTKPGSYIKCFHNTERVMALHNHFPLKCLGLCTTYAVPTNLAQMQHYRKDCVGPLKNKCKEYRLYTTRDVTIWRYKDQLIRRTTEVLYELGFFKEQRSDSSRKLTDSK